MTMEFERQRVLVFGGTSGINLGIARRFAARGASLFLVSRSDEKVAAAVAQIRAEGGRADGMAADVRDYPAVEAAAGRAAADGPLDIVVSGAAGNFLARAADMSANGFRTVIDIDLVGTFHVARACHPHMRRPGSSLIVISAPQGAKPVIGQSHACAAKAGINMLVRCLALEWGSEGIRVNAISPGPIGDTEGMRRLAPGDDETARLAASLPLGSYGRIDEIASAACYLAGREGSYITGTILDIDGGTMLGSGALV